jgi:hypothetical protein
LRSKAQAALSKFSHAKADLKRLLSLDPTNKEGQLLAQKIERQKLIQQRTDKRLAKEVCKWADTAIKASVSSDGPMEDNDEDSPPVTTQNVVHTSPRSTPSNATSFLWLPIVLGIILAWLYQNSYSGS